MLQSSSSFEKQGRAEDLGPHETEVACDNTLGLVLCPGRGIWMLHYLLLNVHSRGQRTMDSRALSTFYTLTRFSPPEHNMVFLSKCQGNFAVLFFLWEEIYCTVLQLEMNFRQVPCVRLGGSPEIYHKLRMPKRGMVANGTVDRARVQMVLNADPKSRRHVIARISVWKFKYWWEEACLAWQQFMRKRFGDFVEPWTKYKTQDDGW